MTDKIKEAAEKYMNESGFSILNEIPKGWVTSLISVFATSEAAREYWEGQKDEEIARLKEDVKAERERARKLVEALQWLLTVKKYKDENGKNEFYEIERLGAWDNARTAINEYNNKPPSENQ